MYTHAALYTAQFRSAANGDCATVVQLRCRDQQRQH